MKPSRLVEPPADIAYAVVAPRRACSVKRSASGCVTRAPSWPLVCSVSQLSRVYGSSTAAVTATCVVASLVPTVTRTTSGPSRSSLAFVTAVCTNV
jgi:hypothetical protein